MELKKKIIISAILLCIISPLLIGILCKNDNALENLLNYMKNGLEDPYMSVHYKEAISDVEELTNGTMEIWYYSLDLNMDGKEDRIVIISSPLHSGSRGDTLEILLNNGSSYTEISQGLTVRLLRQSSDLIPLGGIYVLKSSHEGFFDIKIESESTFLLVYQEGMYQYKGQL